MSLEPGPASCLDAEEAYHLCMLDVGLIDSGFVFATGPQKTCGFGIPFGIGRARF